MIAAKALQPMLDEIEHLRGRIATLEDTQLDIMQQVEDETATSDKLAAERKGIETAMRDLLVQRDKAARELDQQIEGFGEQRKTLAGRLPAELIALYDKIAQRAGGTGAAELRASLRWLRPGVGCQRTQTAGDGGSRSQVLRCEGAAGSWSAPRALGCELLGSLVGLAIQHLKDAAQLCAVGCVQGGKEGFALLGAHFADLFGALDACRGRADQDRAPVAGVGLADQQTCTDQRVHHIPVADRRLMCSCSASLLGRRGPSLMI